ncbi:hypothetical protein D9613_004660 [Agrocybe pediades]|uniref:Cytochrome P450 n=1 Tax=Agrocybe pediades TaxID=84607 RepID=A0A8H4VRN9_9AGAR|nr:hypothetical protein D9613_004660 [Agrocybe pediades]
MAPYQALIDACVALVLLTSAVFIYTTSREQSRALYPPGPRRFPLLGNLLDLPTSFEWVTYARWCKELGSDIIYLHALGNDVVVLDSLEAIEDLLDKRSSTYSSRPRFPMTVEMMGCDWTFALLPYGTAWRDRRRMFAQYFHPSNTEAYQENHTTYVRSILPGLHDRPEDFANVIRYAAAGSAISLAYGLPIKKVNDPIIDLAEQTIAKINASVLPTNFFVNLVPALKYLPEFMPGSGFKAKAKEWRQLSETLNTRPFEEKKGTVAQSFTSSSLDELSRTGRGNPKDRKVIMDVAASIFVGAADTTVAIVSTFIATMLCFPQAQRKAQQELDRVLGGRLPEFSDEPDLPYIAALVKEVIRLAPITPVAAPHTATEDDVYRGYYIPKGTIVIPNSWSLLHDEVHYPEPEAFKPERFLKDGRLNPEIRDPNSIIFGYGRRVCPGSHIGLSFFWMAVATILSTFKISEEVDENGSRVKPDIKWHTGVICEPAPFKCTFNIRSRKAEKLVESIQFEEGE